MLCGGAGAHSSSGSRQAGACYEVRVRRKPVIGLALDRLRGIVNGSTAAEARMTAPAAASSVRLQRGPTPAWGQPTAPGGSPIHSGRFYPLLTTPRIALDVRGALCLLSGGGSQALLPSPVDASRRSKTKQQVTSLVAALAGRTLSLI